MNNLALPGLTPGPVRRRGRPPGSGNKRSGDLRAYIEAVYGGLTPGQQAAAVGLVTAREVRDAKAEAKTRGLSPVVQAMATNAKALAQVLCCDPKEAWLLMMKEREALLPYVHQRLAPREGEKGDPTKGQPMLIVADVEPGPELQHGYEEAEVFQGPALPPPDQVAHPKSHEP